MVTQSLTMGSLVRGNDGTWAYHIANATSYIINPLCLQVLISVLVAQHFQVGREQVWRFTALTLIFSCLVPLAYIYWMVKTGRTASLEIREREARTKPLLFGLGSNVLGGLLMVLGTTVPDAVVWGLVSVQLATTLIMLFITQWWKISLHMTGLAGSLAVFCFIARHEWVFQAGHTISGAWVYPSLLSIPLLMWARVRVGAHTIPQVIGGSCLAFGVTYLVLHLLETKWWQVAF